MDVVLDADLRWEVVSDDVLALDVASGVVHRLSGDAARVARHLLAGEPLPDSLEAAGDALVNAGLCRATRSNSRRRFLQGAAAAAAGITTMALPLASAAASTVTGEVAVTYTGGTYTDADVTITRDPATTRVTNINASWQTATLTYTQLGINYGPFTIEKIGAPDVAPAPPAEKKIEQTSNSSIAVYLSNSQAFKVTVTFQTKTTVYNVPPL